MMDMFKMLGRLGEIKEKMEDAREKISSIHLTESELDVVTVDISADKVIHKVQTTSAFYEKYSIEEREEILAEVMNNAIKKADAKAKEVMQAEMKDVLPNIPGMDLSSMLPF